MRGWIVRIAIIGVIALGGLIFRERLSGSAGDLAVGECFDVPAGDTNIGDVQHHPCSEAHTGEVFALVKNPAAKGTPPPTSPTFSSSSSNGPVSRSPRTPLRLARPPSAPLRWPRFAAVSARHA